MQELQDFQNYPNNDLKGNVGFSRREPILSIKQPDRAGSGDVSSVRSGVTPPIQLIHAPKYENPEELEDEI